MKWSAVCSRAWPDAWPPHDAGLIKALGLPNTASGWREAEAIAEPWRPWRSYALMHLWPPREKTALHLQGANESVGRRIACGMASSKRPSDGETLGVHPSRERASQHVQQRRADHRSPLPPRGGEGGVPPNTFVRTRIYSLP